MKTDYHASLEPGNYYHLYNKAVSNRKLFVKDSDCKRFMHKFNRYLSPYMYLTAYCLIPNHFHFLVHIKPITAFTLDSVKKEKTRASSNYLSEDISFNDFLVDQIRRFISSHALYINKKYQLQGQLFLKKMKRTAVNSQEKLLNLVKYIHHNPIHHGISYEYENWQYSSYNDYLNNPEKEEYRIILSELGNGNMQDGIKEFTRLHEKYKTNYLKNL